MIRPGRLLIWRGLDAWRSEVASIRFTRGGLSARGTQVAADPLPYRLDYRLEAPADFVTARIVVTAEGAGWWRRLDLGHDGNGAWTAATEVEGEAIDLGDPGGSVEALAGALDCDLGLSPLTNAMPIARSGLAHRGGAEDFLMAWISVPDLGVVASAQRYEHVRTDEEGAVVRYVDRGLFPGFEADLDLDQSGLVRCYPGLAEAVEPRDQG